MDAPRAIVEVDGVDVKWTDLIDLQLEQTLYMAADSFDITFNNSNLLSDWFRKEQELRIYLGYVKDPSNWSKSDLTHMFTGKIDGVKPYFENPNKVELLGRDYSAKMIDTQSTLAFNNQSSGQIAQYFANKYGLNFVGEMGVVDIDKEMLTDKKEWDVLQSLADREGFICYVDKDKNLYFGPRQDSDDNIIYTFSREDGNINCYAEFDDSSLGVYSKLTVKHWYKKQLIQASAENTQLSQSIGQVKEKIIYDSKAKTPELAQEIANKRLKDYSRQVITGIIYGAMTPEVVPEKKITFKGGGRFANDYYVERALTQIQKTGATIEVDVTNLRPDDTEQYRSDLYIDKNQNSNNFNSSRAVNATI
jgi:prophage tail gpP-like protein